MSLVSALFTGVTGLSGNSQALEVLGDNISNVNTVGFKSSRPVFGDILSTILNNGSTQSQIGRGTTMSGTVQSFSQGSFESTDNALDLAIDGSGFFVVAQNGGNFFTRAGQFRLNDSGLVQSITGHALQGRQINNGITSGTVSDVDIAGVQSAPAATTSFTLGANLNAAASAGTTFTSPISTFDSLGATNTLSVTFTKQSGTNQWGYGIIPSAGSISAGSSGTVTFNTAGQLSLVNGAAVADQTITFDFTGADPTPAAQSITWDLANATGTNGKLTGYAAQSNNNSLVQDGFATGVLVGLNVNGSGIIQGLFDNGQTDNLFEVAMAEFLAPTGLTRTGNNLFAESASSGSPTLGSATAGSFGAIVGSSLELSNVDLSSQFVTLIQTQQAFQAAARIINTTDDMLTETVNLVR
jgi:flagellar hook protein FlgE